MEQKLVSESLKAFSLLRQAASEYNNAQYKFYSNGFVKYVNEGRTFLIEDIYIEPEFRGTPVASIILEEFTKFMEINDVIMYYGYVFKASPDFRKRLDKFKKWGMKVHSGSDTENFVIVSKMVG